MALSSLWSHFKKRRTIRLYRHRLNLLLRKDYGRQRHYTPAQVGRALNRSALNLDYSSYAYAMFCDRESFYIRQQQKGQSGDYEAMRQEAAHYCYGGNFRADRMDATGFNGGVSTSVSGPGGSELRFGHSDCGGDGFGGVDFGDGGGGFGDGGGDCGGGGDGGGGGD